MDKVKLAICMQDLEYQARFVNCFMNHYQHLYEVHVFTDVEELKSTNLHIYSSVIMDEYTTEEMTNFVEGGPKLLCLTEAEDGDEKYASEQIVCSEKYQEVYKITETIEKMTAGEAVKNRRGSGCRRTAVLSFTREQFQIVMSALLAELYGENERVLILDLQPYSGFEEIGLLESRMGLEDILASAIIGNYSKGRILETIGHATNWDYVNPVRNTECLTEGNAQLYEAVLQILNHELGYERIVINFGAVFPGYIDLLSQCEDIYLLTDNEKTRSWREQSFCDELQRKEKEGLYQRMNLVEISGIPIIDGRWQSVLERLRYSPLEERLRQSIERGKHYGEIM